MKNLRLTVLAALLACSASQVAFAQAPGEPNYTGAPATGAPGTTAPVADSGEVTNGASTTTVTTTTSTSGIAPDGTVTTGTGITADEAAATTDSTLTNTGGEPVLMTLVGLAIAASAFAFRRKVSA